MVSTLFPQRVLHLYERHGRRLPPLAQLLLALLIGVLAARWIWALVPVPEAARWQPVAVMPVNPAPQSRKGPDVEAIVAAQLFGQYQAQPVGADALETAPDTRLSLTLMGILAGSPEASRALIANSGGEEKPYAIGDDVVAGASLQAIFFDRVILSRNGQLETLRLNRDAPSAGGSDYVRPVAAGGSAMLGQIREQILTDPTKASNFIRVQPANVDGQLRGYRVYPGREREAFTESGLRPGDLVTSINGIQLDDNQKALQMLGDLSRAGSISVTVERGGQQQTLNFSFN